MLVVNAGADRPLPSILSAQGLPTSVLPNPLRTGCVDLVNLYHLMHRII